MPDGSGFFPPVQYNVLWLLLGVVLLLVVIGWLVFVLWFTRRTPAPFANSAYYAGPDFPGTSLRESYLGLIDEVERANREGALSSREAHQRLGLLVREFAAQVRGVRAQYMTLEDLRATPLGPLAETVGELYPGSFAGEESTTVSLAAGRARKLVGEWR